LAPQSTEEFLERANPVETKAHKSVARGVGDNAAPDDENVVNVVIDVGGTGTRLALSVKNGIQSIHYANPDSLSGLIDEIRKLTNNMGPDALAMAVPGWIRNKQVMYSHIQWLEGNPAETIRRELALRDDKIHLIHDGEAHALALTKRPDVKFGAIHLSVGSGVGLGVIGEDGKVLRSLSGDSWELNDVRLVTSVPDKEVWRLMSAAAFKEQQERTDTDGYEYFGRQLGSLASQLTLILRPRTVGLSGGVIRHHWRRIKGGFLYETDKWLGNLGHAILVPELVVLDDENTALLGLATIF
jgi:glucokinase